MSSAQSESRTSWLPQGLVVLVCYWVIRSLLTLGDRGISPFISAVWWNVLLSRAVLVVMMLALIPILLRRERLAFADLGYRARWTLKDMRWGVGAGVSIWLLHNALLDWASAYAVSGWVNEGVRIKNEMFLDAGGVLKAAGIMSAVVLAPFVEELVYRGVLISSFMRRWGGGAKREILYALASALIFAFAHVLSHPVYYAIYAVTGVLLASLYIKTRSLNAVFLAHVVINGIYYYHAFRGPDIK